MNDILKIGLVGVGGYLLYKIFWGSSPNVVPGMPSETPAPEATNPTPYTPIDTTIQGQGGSYAYPLVTQEALYGKLGTVAGSGATADEWSWAYSQVTGVSIPGEYIDKAFGPIGQVGRQRWYGYQEWANLLVTAGMHIQGLSGIGGFRGTERVNNYEGRNKYYA